MCKFRGYPYKSCDCEHSVLPQHSFIQRFINATAPFYTYLHHRLHLSFITGFFFRHHISHYQKSGQIIFSQNNYLNFIEMGFLESPVKENILNVINIQYSSLWVNIN